MERLNILKSQYLLRLLYVGILFLLLERSPLFAQVTPGASFLRTLPGARVQAMSGSVTAGLDVTHAFYANPGAAGFLREWQWGASYTKWIADVYNASFIFGKRVRTPWSRHSRVALGVYYQGMGDFDSSDGVTPMATANDILVSATLGQPLSFVSRWLSVGANVKYFKSTLDQFNADAFIFDAGLFCRTPRFALPTAALGILQSGIFSAGISVVNVGSDLEYISSASPLPRALRGGIAFNAGTHNGLQTQLSLDYVQVRDEQGGLSFGAEVSWNRFFSIDAGYRQDQGLLDQITLGLSLSLDDIRMPGGKLLPGRNKAVRLDLATLDDQEFFSRTYRGGLTHFSIGPEHFHFINPAEGVDVESDSVAFVWEETQDPDLYDAVTWHFLLTKDSLEIANALQSIENDESEITDLASDGFIVNETPAQASFALANPGGGDYYWAVIASDKNGHLRFADRNGKHIAHFHIPLPDLIVKDIQFDYDHVINESEKQGALRIIVENIGETWAKNIELSLRDSVVVPIKNPPDLPLWVHKSFHTIPELMPGQLDTITIDWYRASSGLCEISATADFENKIAELNDENNRRVESFYTIPKGTFAADDTSNVLLTSRVIIELPFINEICMDAESTKVKYPYLHYTSFDGPLDVLVRRLNENRQFSVSLIGYADPNSEKGMNINGVRTYAGPIVNHKKSRAIFINSGFAESLQAGTAAFVEPLFNLAYRRSLAVRDSLTNRGVLPTQIRIDSVKVWKRRYVPSDTTDARWIFEERRQVTISTDNSAQNTLFAPVPRVDNEGLKPPVKFSSAIKSVLPLDEGELALLVPRDSDSLNFNISLPLDSLENDTAQWNLHVNDSSMVASMINRKAIYHITIKDSLGRVFWNEPQQTLLRQGTFLRDHKISFPLQFAGTSPMYGLYWARILKLAEQLFDDPYMHMRFEGHACATGPEAINLTLSKKRANAFYDKFLTFLGSLPPADSAKIAGRLDPPKGYGESRPLKIERLDKRKKTILIGDNQSAIGRKFNRRIEIIFTSTAKKPRFIY